VSACSTSAKFSSRAASASAFSRLGARTSTTYGEVAGLAASSLSVWTDSLAGSLRFRGSKSKVTAGNAASDARPTNAATATTILW
jgi:hypothetical protein